MEGLGQSSLPIWVRGTIEFVWAGRIPLNPHHKFIPPQNHVFRVHFLAQKGPQAKMLTRPFQNLARGRFWELFQITPTSARSQS